MSIDKKTNFTLIFFNLAGIFLFIILLLGANHYEQLEAEVLIFLTFEFSKKVLVDILVHLAGATIIGVIVTNFLKRFNERDLTQKLDELKIEMIKIFPKVQHVPVEIGLEQAIYHLKNMDEKHENIYAVGIGKSELYNTSPVIQEYYDKTEETLKNRHTAVYKRITTNNTFQKNFLSHLSNVLEVNETNHERVQLLVSENEQLVSDALLIVGNKFLFISPTSIERGGNKKIIGSNCFVTEDKEIIEQYTEHFEDMWSKYAGDFQIITKINDFNRAFNMLPNQGKR